jgi:hypothetical protein
VRFSVILELSMRGLLALYLLPACTEDEPEGSDDSEEAGNADDSAEDSPDPTTGTIHGTVTFPGSAPEGAKLWVTAGTTFPTGTATDVTAVELAPASGTEFSLAVIGGNWYVESFLDSDGNGAPTKADPATYYGAPGTPKTVTVTVGATSEIGEMKLQREDPPDDTGN